MMLRDVVKPGVLTNVGPDGDQQIPVYPGTRLGVDICGISASACYTVISCTDAAVFQTTTLDTIPILRHSNWIGGTMWLKMT